VSRLQFLATKEYELAHVDRALYTIHMPFPPEISVQGLFFWIALLSGSAGAFFLFRLLPFIYIDDGWDEDQVRGMIRWSVILFAVPIVYFTVIGIGLFI
jgi:hypothetical protein